MLKWRWSWVGVEIELGVELELGKNYSFTLLTAAQVLVKGCFIFTLKVCLKISEGVWR